MADLTFTAGLDDAPFSRGLRRMGSAADTAASGIVGAFGKMATRLAGAGAVFNFIRGSINAATKASQDHAAYVDSLTLRYERLKATIGKGIIDTITFSPASQRDKAAAAEEARAKKETEELEKKIRLTQEYDDALSELRENNLRTLGNDDAAETESRRRRAEQLRRRAIDFKNAGLNTTEFDEEIRQLETLRREEKQNDSERKFRTLGPGILSTLTRSQVIGGGTVTVPQMTQERIAAATAARQRAEQAKIAQQQLEIQKRMERRLDEYARKQGIRRAVWN